MTLTKTRSKTRNTFPPDSFDNCLRLTEVVLLAGSCRIPHPILLLALRRCPTLFNKPNRRTTLYYCTIRVSFHLKIMQEIPTFATESYSISVRHRPTSCLRINVGIEPKFWQGSKPYGNFPQKDNCSLFSSSVMQTISTER